MSQDYFTFELTSDIDLGIPLSNMVTATQFEVSNTCTVPGVAHFWYGVVNFKGSLLWVLDSERFFRVSGMNNKRLRKLTTIVLKNDASIGHKQLAITTPRLKGIVSLESASLNPLTEQVSSVLRDCCSAMAAEENRMLLIIDAAMLMQHLHHQSSLLTV